MGAMKEYYIAVSEAMNVDICDEAMFDTICDEATRIAHDPEYAKRYPELVAEYPQLLEPPPCPT